ncbi:DUF2283 domain-containing protein [Pseudomonas sp. GL-B-19]|uniref:DUF2283 domain-containing protein n=1 Tax=Pseudomonas sp. GL-B-19 TaxID=2832393 RepID=UPI001CC1BE5A|nr:DUF2283 domain-containing protein [Pseudomonas sp. GL-B-19]
MTTQITNNPDSNSAYMKFSKEKVAYTLPIDEGVLADYDKDGGVVGIEVIFLSQWKNLNWSEFHAKAMQKTKGGAKKPTPKMSK